MSGTQSYKRILLKLSGEALAGKRGFGIDQDIINRIAVEVCEVQSRGIEIAVVIGGGNIFRGVSDAVTGSDRASADTVGMLATLMNSILFKEALVRSGACATVLTAIRADAAAEFYTPRRAKELLSSGTIVIIAGGTGNPFFTTDTAAALRCAETNCDVFFKATKVDGIYDSDPVNNPNALKLQKLTHSEALSRKIKVMDTTAFSLCMDNNITIIVFKLLESGNLLRCIKGEQIGSIVVKEQ